MKDIEHHMLHFLDNHDEQRLASPEFAGSGAKGKPMMVVSATISTSPTMIYFGQEVGEAADENAGFGTRSRTSIFDYIGVPAHQKWMNGGKFDGGQLNDGEKDLRDFYKRLLNFTINSKALMANYEDLQFYNRSNTANYDPLIYSYTRWSANEKLIIVSNFSSEQTSEFELKIPADIIRKWSLADGHYVVVDQLYKRNKVVLDVRNGLGSLRVRIAPLESFLYQLDEK